MSNGQQVTIPEIEVNFAENEPQTVDRKEGLVITCTGGSGTFMGTVRFSLPGNVPLSGKQKLVVIFEGEVETTPDMRKNNGKGITEIKLNFGPGWQVK